MRLKTLTHDCIMTLAEGLAFVIVFFGVCGLLSMIAGV